jgi:hypothetical protein
MKPATTTGNYIIVEYPLISITVKSESARTNLTP